MRLCYFYNVERYQNDYFSFKFVQRKTDMLILAISILNYEKVKKSTVIGKEIIKKNQEMS